MENQRIAVTDALICQYEAGYLKGEGLKGKKKKKKAGAIICRGTFKLQWHRQSEK